MNESVLRFVWGFGSVLGILAWLRVVILQFQFRKLRDEFDRARRAKDAKAQ